MLLLAIQYSIQPRISKKYLHKSINKKEVAMVEEVLKVSLATVVLATSGSQKISQALDGWTLSSCLLVAGLPALIYAVQNVLFIFSYQNLDSVTFNGLTQTKTLWTALCCFFVLGQTQSPMQVLSLLVLAASALLFQGTAGKLLSAALSKGSDKNSSHLNTNESQARFTLGVVPCLLASFCSGLAGSLSQKGLQLTGGAGRNASLYTIEVAGFSALCLLVSMLSDRTKKEKSIPFEYWSFSTFYPIVLKALGGVLTVMVHKYAGSVAKGFALICGLVLSGIIQAVVDKKNITLEQKIGIILVNLSSWMHFAKPRSI